MGTVNDPFAAFQEAARSEIQNWQEQHQKAQPWLQEVRTKGLEEFISTPLPTRKTENWKYTPITALTQADVLGQPDAAQESGEDGHEEGIRGEFYSVVFVNGQCQPFSWEDPAVELCSFANASESQQRAIAEQVNRAVDSRGLPFVSMNSAILQDGLLLTIRKDQKPARPIQIIHRLSQNAPKATHGRCLVSVEAGAKAEIVELFMGHDQSDFWRNTVSEVELAENSHLTHSLVHHEQPDNIHTGAVYVEQAAGSQYVQHNFTKGSKLCRRDIQVRLRGPQADCKLNGAYLVGASRHADYHTTVDHIAPHCTSDEVFKGIVTDTGKAVFNGRIHIHRDAQQSNADMSNNNLLLTNTAEVNTKPELEIYADDVKCSHGATVGQLDSNSLYYFQTRGISKSEAYRMLSHAFIETVLTRIEEPGVLAYVQALAEEFYVHCQENAE